MLREIYQKAKMKKSELIDILWQTGYFGDYRQPKQVSEKMWQEYQIDAGNIIMTLKSKKYLRSYSQGWRQIKPPVKLPIKTDEMEEIGRVLGEKFEKEIGELKIALIHQPNCASFLMRKILEKLLFVVISKSSHKANIEGYKRTNNGELPQLTNLLNWAQQAEINGIHICAPRNARSIAGSKFLGDTAAHNYLVSVDFEDIKPEMSYWRILIKELAENL